MNFSPYKKACLPVIAVLLLACSSLQAQNRGSWPSYFKNYNDPHYGKLFFHGGVGLNFYTGDLAKPTSFSNQNFGMNPSLTVGAVYQVTNYAGLRGDFSFTRLGAKSEAEQWGNKKFNTNILSFTVALEHQLFPQISFDQLKTRINVYGLIGFGMMSFSVKHEEEIPSPTEDYGKTALLFPLGVGVKYSWSEFFTFSFEMNYRATSTDYLDDSSTGEKPNDGFFTYQLMARVKLFKKYKFKRHLNSQKKLIKKGD